MIKVLARDRMRKEKSMLPKVLPMTMTIPKNMAEYNCYGEVQSKRVFG